MPKRLGITAATGLAVLLAGCGSPGHPVRQTVRVETPGCERAVCELSNDRGTWRIAATPGAVELESSGTPLRVSCRGPGGSVGSADAIASAPATSRAAPAVGGLAGGAAVGAGIGAAGLAFIPALGLIALATGVAGGAVAAQSAAEHARPLAYPERVVVPLQCEPPVPAGAPTAPLGLKVRGLTPDEAAAAGLPAGAAVQVLAVGAGSPAERAGLQAGDALLALSGQMLLDAADLEARLQALPPGAPALLRIGRQGRVLELSLPRSAPAP